MSLVPSLTETLASWGLADRLVGVTDWCTTPDLPGVARVRGTKNPDLSEIRLLEPDLVVANQEENRRVDVERLREWGIPVWVTAPDSLVEVAATFRRLGPVVGAADEATALADRIDAVRTSSGSHSSGSESGSRPSGSGSGTGSGDRPLRTFCPVWRDPWIAVGTGTIVADLLAHAGFEVVPAVARYPRVDLDEIAAADVDVVLLPDEPYAFGPADLEAFRGWRAAVRFVDGAALTWWGPRTVSTLEHYRALAASLRADPRPPRI